MSSREQREIDPRLLPELFTYGTSAGLVGPNGERDYSAIARADKIGTVTTTASSWPTHTGALRRDGWLWIEDLPTLYAGDQLYVRREIVGPVSEWAVAFLIRVATYTRKDKRPSVVNHVATVIRPIYESEEILADGTFVHYGPVVDYLIAEALGEGGFQYNRLIETYGEERKYSLAIARHKLATPEHRSKMIAAAGSLIGREYGYLKVGAHALDSGLTKVWNLAGGRSDVFLFRWFCRSERYPICSWSSLYIYRKAGLPFSTSLATGSPDDLYDETRRKTRPDNGPIWVWLFVSPKIHDEVYGPGYGNQEGGNR